MCFKKQVRKLRSIRFLRANFNVNMTVRKWFKFGKSILDSDVKNMLFFIVVLFALDNLPLNCKGEDFNRDSRKLFGGYRITPTYCKASRAAKYNRGNTICMFNHECVQRGGEVVGACMDGFLFGACCQLKSDSQSHIPKGPGVIMTSYLDYPEATESDDYDAEELSAWHNSYKPVVTPGYKPSDKSSTTAKPDNLSTEGEHAEMISEGLTQITNTLLSSPPKDNGFIYMKPKPDYYTHSTINHGGPDTILVHTNGTVVNDVVRPSDFNIQVSSMQTKPTVSPSTSTSDPPKTVSTHRPIKPIFKPKPSTSTENYIAINTVTKESKVPELSSINSIIQMLNDSTPSMGDDVTPSIDVMETKSSPSPLFTYPSFSSTGHYVTLKPTSLSTYKTKKPVPSKKPSYDYLHTTPNSLPQDDKPSSYFSSPSPSQSTSQAIEAFNRYPTDPTDFGDLSTFSYVSSTTTPKPTTPKRPPSTSYVTGASPVRRPPVPSSNVPSYDDTFSSVTPTVIVLNDIHTTKTPIESDETQFVEISQEPFKKPVSQITVNNHIESTNNIYMGKPTYYPSSSSPTVVITPKPGPNTTPYPIKASTRPVPSSIRPLPISTTPSYFADVPTTNKPEVQTSPDDSINFPPVRNPLLNATGANQALYNTSVSMSDSELDLLHDVEFTTPTWEVDEKLDEKMNVFVSKIVGNLQGTFQELHDIVILGKKPNDTAIRTTTTKPKKTLPTTKRPFLTTTKRTTKFTTTKATTRKPTVKTTKKPTRLTTQNRKPTTTQPPTTTVVTTTTTKKTKVTTTKKTKPPKKGTTTVASPSTTELSDEITTENYVEKPIDYNDKNLCGVRPLAKTGRIVGGKNTKFGDWPWQVLVRESTWLGLITKNKCGGVLITNKFVTTAAHCQPGFLASLVAVFGESDISGDHEPRKPVSRNVRKVIVHRQYDAATFENDLALLELDTPIKFDAHIVPICMPADDSDFTGRVATVTGWGRLEYNGVVPAILQEVQVPVIENSACQEMFQTAGHLKKILNSFICAGYANGRKDSCEGDSGGPLVLQRDDGKWQLVGTVSHGIKCAAPFLPGVYMRTTYYKPWLKSITGVR